MARSGSNSTAGLAGGQYAIRAGLILLGILGGKYGATPQIGGQIGISIDFPEVRR